VRFQIEHEFDAPLDALELAVLSPDLGTLLARSLTSIESIETLEHVLERGELRRVLRFQASAPLAIFKDYPVTREVMSWRELWTYRLADHASTWTVTPKDEWARYVRSSGTYRLEPLPLGRSRRTVIGDLEVNVGILGGLAERLAIAEVRKTYDAEADTLRALASL
jgi:hypothetical protein